MALQYYYNYAEIDPDTNMCISVLTTTVERTESAYFVAIPVYDEDYCFKYYINGAWYEDPEGTIPWISTLL